MYPEKVRIRTLFTQCKDLGRLLKNKNLSWCLFGLGTESNLGIHYKRKKEKLQKLSGK